MHQKPNAEAHGLWKGAAPVMAISVTWASDTTSPSFLISKTGTMITPTSQDYCKNEME